MPNFSSLASMVWEEEEVTDGRMDRGRHAISLTSPLALLARDIPIRIVLADLHLT